MITHEFAYFDDGKNHSLVQIQKIVEIQVKIISKDFLSKFKLELQYDQMSG